MLEVVFPINQNVTRPVFKLYGVDALLDPGAELPILDLSEDVITRKFGGKYLGSSVPISGYGGTGHQNYKLFLLREFGLGQMVYENIPVAVGPSSMVKVSMVLGSTMFGAGTITTIDTGRDEIRIRYSEQAINGKCLWKKNSKNIWKKLEFENGDWIFS